MRNYILAVVAVVAAWAQMWAGTKVSVNANWTFFDGREPDTAVRVDLPHTWNAADADDDTDGYYRGTGHYVKSLTLPETIAGKCVFLEFEGANQTTSLRVNGHEAGEHLGGYSAFVFDITPYVHPGQNEIEVTVDNSHNPDIAPLSADFTFFGGIYRDVFLEIEEPVHFSRSDYASSGVYVVTSEVADGKGRATVYVLVDNFGDKAAKIAVDQRLVSPDGKVVARAEKKGTVAAGAKMSMTVFDYIVDNPALWSPDTPAQYSVETTITAGGRVVDTQTDRFGFRWFEFDPDHGFSLNGKPLKLMGTNRHQDFKDKGWALSDDYLLQDIRLIKDMGANFLRVSHYPQDPLLMDACDREGLITTVEIPVVNAVTESEAFLSNSLDMLREMIKQNFNRPSVVAWAYMNEVLLSIPYKEGDLAREHYLKGVKLQADTTNAVAKVLDPSRYTLLPCFGNLALYSRAGLLDSADIIGWNLYQGWYGGKFGDFDAFLDDFHAKYPSKPVIITEYGSDCDSRIHSDTPQKYDYSMEYTDLYQEHYLRAIAERRFVAGANLWNLNEFYSEARGNAVPHVNLKGIVTLDRRPKNTYWLYKANLAAEPFVQFANADWTRRAAQLDSTGSFRTEIKIYTNLPEVSLSINGGEPSTIVAEGGVARADVDLKPGANNLLAVAGGCAAAISIDLHGIPYHLDGTFTDISVLAGASRSFTDPATGVCWMPEQPYRPGSWGYVGGEPYTLKNWVGSLPASDVSILGTANDPLYQTARRGLDEFRFDVPDGDYALYLHWADLTKEEYQALVYELGNSALHEESDDCFDVTVNGVTVLPALDVRAEAGRQRPLDIRVDVTATGGRGVAVGFTHRRGQTFINAIRLVRK